MQVMVGEVVVRFVWACHDGHVGLVCMLLGLAGEQTGGVHACWVHHNGHVAVMREVLSLLGLETLSMRAEDMGESGFDVVWACSNRSLCVICELLTLSDGRSVDANAQGEAAHRLADREDVWRSLVSSWVCVDLKQSPF